MANSSTLVSSCSMRGKTIYAYRVVVDTTGSDLTIRTPLTGNHIFLMGIIGSEASATNITWKSGANTLVTTEQAANQGLWAPVSRGSFYLFTEKGSALVMQASVAVDSLLMYVAEESTF